MTSVAVVYYSGYGHTQKLAEAVMEGVIRGSDVEGVMVSISPEGEINEVQWAQLDAADAIIFGSPTYMGTVSWQFKRMADDSSKRWFSEAWKNKISAGFTNSASMNGDKATTLNYLMTFAMQHGMIWVGTALQPSATKEAKRNDINYLGSYAGLMAQSPSDSTPEEGPVAGDLETAKLFGARIAGVATGAVALGMQ